MMKALLILSSLLLWGTGCSKLAEPASTGSQNKCLVCHALPPTDRVHSAHVTRAGFDCAVCHPGTFRQADSAIAPAGAIHANGMVDVDVAEIYDTAGTFSYSTERKSCAGAYCHGNFKGGTHAVVGITDSIAANQCTACHQVASMADAGHAPHYKNGLPGRFLFPQKPGNCGICHLFPPADRVHSAHVTRAGYECSLCHSGTQRQADSTMVPSEILHLNGTVDVAIDSTYNSARTAVYSLTSKNCSGVYCHGNFKDGTHAIPGVNDSIADNDCTSCHDSTAMTDVGHGPHTMADAPGFFMYPENPNRCDRCHPGYNLSPSDRKVDKATHINRSVEVDYNGCFGCHANPHPASQNACSNCHR